MIDRAARNTMATALRRLFSRRITNDEFEVMRPREPSGDSVLHPIYHWAWLCYSDNHEHKLARDLAHAVRKDVARFVLFLHSDLEYRWPPMRWLWAPIISWPLTVLTLGWWARVRARHVREWESHGDVEAWPFLTSSELSAACAQPRFLVGSS